MLRLFLPLAVLAALVASPWSGEDALAQTASTSNEPVFEVASVKVNKSSDGRTMLTLQPGRFVATDVPLRTLIAAAYGSPQMLPAYRMVGGPAWIDSDRFDIMATFEGEPPPAMVLSMLRQLLAERFQLRTHSEQRDLSIYALMLAGGDRRTRSNLRPSDVDCAAWVAVGQGGNPGERPVCGSMSGPGTLQAGAISMARLAELLSGRVGRLVVDKTDLQGQFDLDLTWAPDALSAGIDALPSVQQEGAPSMFTALQEQLGLKLESTRGPVDVLVIDRVGQPAPD